jgi:hypothetical protein
VAECDCCDGTARGAAGRYSESGAGSALIFRLELALILRDVTAVRSLEKAVLPRISALQRGLTRSRGTAMQVPFVQSLTVIAALAGSLAVAGIASATEAAPAEALLPSPALTSALALRLRPTPPDPGPATPPWAADVRGLLSEQRPAADCTKPCNAANGGPFIADQLLNELGSDPLLGTVMAPITRGVPISTGDGTPALKLAVIPTQITRGSGFVAIGHF